MKTFIPKIPKLIWKRLPWIVAYTLAFTGLLFLGEFMYYRYSPGERFVNYNSFQFNTATEHKDVPFQACKDTDYAYKVDGERKIYRIPEGKGEIDKERVGGYPLDSIISKERCVSAFISTKQYDFEPGNYQVYTTFNFSVKYGNRKSVTFKSNIFTVVPARPSTVEEIQKKIDELQKQIDLLKLQLAATQAGVSFAPQADTQLGTTQAQQTTSDDIDSFPEDSAPSSQSQQPQPPTTTPPPDNEGIIINLPLLPEIRIPSPF